MFLIFKRLLLISKFSFFYFTNGLPYSLVTKLACCLRVANNQKQRIKSRLDYIFVSQYLTSRITNVEVKYGFELSDHASVLVEMHVNEI